MNDAMSARDIEYENFVRLRRAAMLRSAMLLADGDLHLAEDLVQVTLIRLYMKWPRVRKMNVDAYARRVLVNNLMDHYRKPSVRRECRVSDVPDSTATSPDLLSGVGDSVEDQPIVSALAKLPPRMRAAVVLRYVEGLDVEETAHALGCSAGTVKSQASRGLEKLRGHLEIPSGERAGCANSASSV